MFHITDTGVRKITLVAGVGEVTTIQVDMFAKLNKVDITSTEINKDDAFDSHTYEVTIKQIKPQS